MPSRSVFPFRSDIEGLRAIAVLAVVGFHYGIARIAGGFVGVDVFFVISGYLITGLLLSELASSDRIDFVRFYGRRARRLLPAALTVCIATLVAAPLIISPLELKAVARASVASSLYLSNYLFLHQSFGYFSPESASNPFLHTWSLSVEEQFYLVWPAFLLLVGRSGRKYTLVFAILALTGTSPGGHLKIPHPWTGQTPPPDGGGTMDDYAV